MRPVATDVRPNVVCAFGMPVNCEGHVCAHGTMCKMGVHIGATWRIRLNNPCTTAMRPCDRIFDHALQWRFHAGPGGGVQAPQIVARPPYSPVLWTHCGQLILRKISKFDATRCQILRLKCTKFDFRWDCAPDPARESLQRSPTR